MQGQQNKIKIPKNCNHTKASSSEVCKLARMQVKLIRMSVRGHMIRNDIHTGHLMLFFPLHPAILEPDFNLSFRKTQGMSYFDASSPR